VPVLLIERERGVEVSEAQLVADVRALAAKHETTKAITQVHVFPGEFPVDRRHNAKIEREKLAVWAADKGLAE
jgi:hypothetical protein